MIKDIIYNGITATPSDYSSPDGDLAMAIGLVQEGEAMTPILAPKEVLQLEEGEKIIYIHETPNFKHYIIQNSENNIFWRGSDEESEYSLLNSFTTEILQTSSVSNTLIILASDGMHYFLWKGDIKDYLYLGTEIPECPLSFGLQGEMVKDNSFNVGLHSVIKEDKLWDEFTEDNKNKISEFVLPKVNEFIAKHSKKKGKFIYPFLLRYAYRLYDGSLIKHSAPILMIASSDLVPQAFVNYGFGAEEDWISSIYVEIAAVTHQIDFAAVSQVLVDNIKNWKDIVKSIDVFVSSPIYTYDQNGLCQRLSKITNTSDCYTVCKHTNQTASTNDYPIRYQYNTLGKLYAFTFNPGTLTYPTSRLMLPQRDKDTIKTDIKECSQFYFLESIKIDTLSTTRTLINVKEDYLETLEVRELMTDDYDSHDKIMPTFLYPYNARLNIANIKKLLFRGHNAYSLFNYSNGYVNIINDGAPTLLDITLGVIVFVFIKQDGKEIVVKGQLGTVGYNMPLLFFYYPNPNAYKAVIQCENSFYEVPLERHTFLNGAFYFNGWEDLKSTAKSVKEPTISGDNERTIRIPNNIYTSEVNNPFFFPATNITQINTDNILAISSATKALSEGQFGQFPLYAFTSDGVWALEVSKTGSFSAVQPITRDVAINTESICQIDSAVLFASDRGIMMINGSTTQCISDIINTEDLFDIKTLPKHKAMIDIFNSNATENEKICIDDISMLPFKDFISGCQMVYDYTHQHIIIYNPSVKYAYVLSLKSQTWGMMLSKILDNVNSYPEALALVEGAKLVDFSKSDATAVPILLITRPLKFDSSQYKTINTIIQRGNFKKGHIKQILYGSNDLQQWHTVWSSADEYLRGFRGSPYKYFRLAVIGNLDKDESIFGFTAEFENRLTNRLR